MEEENVRNIYQEALDVQDACNLSGVVISWAEIMKVICEEARDGGHGTDWKNKHPVNVLFASKVESLTGLGASQVFLNAYDECRKKAIEKGGRG